MTVALVVGYGSIGRRHARVLRELGCQVVVASRRQLDDVPRHATIAEALRAATIDYVVIANETSEHELALAALIEAGFTGRVLVEKPLGIFPTPLPRHGFALAAVGYNLRFHPVLTRLAAHLRGERILTAQVYCGQDLATWRPQADYRQGYSASSERGGGALRDLSHELDYVQWLCGPWRRVAAIGGRLGDLEISSDDCWGLLLELDNCPLVTLQVNYLDRPGARQILINTARHTFRADLVAHTLECDGAAETFAVARDDTYRAQHKAILAGRAETLCALSDAARTMQLVAAAERAARTGTWVRR